MILIFVLMVIVVTRCEQVYSTTNLTTIFFEPNAHILVHTNNQTSGGGVVDTFEFYFDEIAEIDSKSMSPITENTVSLMESDVFVFDGPRNEKCVPKSCFEFYSWF